MLTQRDRKLVADVLRTIVARDIHRRGILRSYKPACLTIHVATLLSVSDDLLCRANNDNTHLVASIVADVDDGREQSPYTELDAFEGEMPSILRALESEWA